MNTQIIYAGKYGSTRRYAEKFSDITGFPVTASLSSVRNADRVILFGALYAGVMLGLKQTAVQCRTEQQLILVSVGMTDTRCEKLVEGLKKGVEDQLPSHWKGKCPMFHLMGAFDKSVLNLKDKAMVSVLQLIDRHLPEQKKTEEMKMMFDCFSSVSDHVDEKALDPILEALK